MPVLLPYPFRRTFIYRIGDNLLRNPPLPGDLVQVPLKGRLEMGVIWDKKNPSLPASLQHTEENKPIDVSKIRDIANRLDYPSIPPTLRCFIDWVAAYTLTPPGRVLAMALRGIGPVTTRTQTGWQATVQTTTQLKSAAQRRVWNYIPSDGPILSKELLQKAHVSPSVLKRMAKAGLIQSVSLAIPPLFAAPDPTHLAPHLSKEQSQAAGLLCQPVFDEDFTVTLLEGITGSGKTQTYFEAVAAAIRMKRQVLVLLPEIALSSQWINQFEKRFGTKPAIWHSGITMQLRRQTRDAIVRRQAQVVVGARSALFLPFQSLGLIVVDEEHDSSYKQEEGVIYHARDMAIVRARLSSTSIILASATPSLETLHNVNKGRYRHAKLTQRHGGAHLPHIKTIDMRLHPPEKGRFLSPLLVQAMAERLHCGEQTMLFLNRRGYAPLTLCRQCGHRMQCPNCTAWLVEHRTRHILLCHYCDYLETIPETCSSCQGADTLTAIGPGVERIAEETRLYFPNARIKLMTSDTIPTICHILQAVQDIAEHRVDLIIGTQMVAKGWHFPYLTLVGIVDADLGLEGGDLRAGEHTMQMLHQVSGRAGRENLPGNVILQSYMPEHPVITTLMKGDFSSFMAHEANIRKSGFWPPFGRLAALIISGDSSDVADHVAFELARVAPVQEGVQVLGPAPAPLTILRGKHRRRILLRSIPSIPLQPLLNRWLPQVKIEGHVKIHIDIDPISFL